MKYLQFLYIFLFLFFVLSSCTSSKKKSNTANGSMKNPTPPKGYSPSPALQLTHQGINEKPEFSPNGDQIIFISSNRGRNKNKQIYQYDLKQRNTRRISFLYGNVFDVTYNGKSNIMYYSSDTDELKERSPILTKKEFDKTMPPTEIYKMTLPSGKIDRLTKAPGFDGLPQVTNNEKYIYYIRYTSNNYYVYRKDLKTKKQSKLYKTKNPISKLSYSEANNELVWSEKENNTYKLVKKSLNNSKRSSSKPNNFKDPHWHPGGQYIVFSSNYEDNNNYELYVTDRNFECTQRLSYNAGQDLNPSFDPSGTKITFQSDRSGEKQVYVMNFIRPRPCAK